MNFIFFTTLWNILYVVISTPQATFENTTTTATTTEQTTATTKRTDVVEKLFKTISAPITRVFEIPTINNVMRNIGTCIVNGVMEIVTHYLPAPFIPLITSAAGSLIPFEPIITLRRLMPVTSYKRAFQSAVNGFLNTFERYKLGEDPYMTRWFRRRFLGDDDKGN